MGKNSWCKFTVQGSKDFPLDMLRYDACYPATSEDAINLAAKDSRKVTLISTMITDPTAGRWNSFGWQVTDKTIIK